MAEDKDAAHKAAERDVAGFAQQLKQLSTEHDIPVDVVSAEAGVLPDIPGDGEGCWFPFSIGTRDRLTKEEARMSAQFYRRVRQRYPKAKLYINILGYDQDPREIWEFPEVRRFFRWWVRFAELDTEELPATGNLRCIW